jgi:hypothetical protein
MPVIEDHARVSSENQFTHVPGNRGIVGNTSTWRGLTPQYVVQRVESKPEFTQLNAFRLYRSTYAFYF